MEGWEGRPSRTKKQQEIITRTSRAPVTLIVPWGLFPDFTCHESYAQPTGHMKQTLAFALAYYERFQLNFLIQFNTLFNLNQSNNRVIMKVKMFHIQSQFWSEGFGATNNLNFPPQKCRYIILIVISVKFQVESISVLSFEGLIFQGFGGLGLWDFDCSCVALWTKTLFFFFVWKTLLFFLQMLRERFFYQGEDHGPANNFDQSCLHQSFQIPELLTKTKKITRAECSIRMLDIDAPGLIIFLKQVSIAKIMNLVVNLKVIQFMLEMLFLSVNAPQFMMFLINLILSVIINKTKFKITNSTGMSNQMLQGTKKRRVPTSEFSGKFDCKADFMKYFKDHLQLYMPSVGMVNKDFLKQVLTEEKRLMPISDVRFINVPMYDELSVKRMWPDMKNSPDFMRFFPDKLPIGRLPDRDYFFNMLNTCNPAYVAELIKHANEQRHSVEQERNSLQVIEVTEGWLDKLNSQPFISNHKGRTLHLLKKESKPTPMSRKRRKLDIFCSPHEFSQHQSQQANYQMQQKPADATMTNEKSSFQDISKLVIRRDKSKEKPQSSLM